MLFLSLLYFILNKVLLGGWVGHYGEGVHLNFEIKNIAANCLKYFSKYLSFWRDWNHTAKEAFVNFCESPLAAYGFFWSMYNSICWGGYIFYRKLNDNWA